MTKKKNKGGRPTLYDPSVVLPRLEKYCKKGLSNAKIALSFGISETTLYEWEKKYPEFSWCLKKHKGLADIEVENALYKTAVGFEFIEEHSELQKQKNGKYEMKMIKTVTKQVNPNPTAQIFYLSNRKANEWKRKVETEITLGAGMESVNFTAKRREA